MAQPNYKLKDDHVATVGHVRGERTRNDATYATKTTSNSLQQQITEEVKTRGDADQILNASITDLYAKKISASGDTMLGNLGFNNTNKIINLANGTNAQDAVTKSQLDLKSDASNVYTKTEIDN